MASFPDVAHTFGGTKLSGFGKDLGEYALEAYVPRLLHLSLSVADVGWYGEQIHQREGGPHQHRDESLTKDYNRQSSKYENSIAEMYSSVRAKLETVLHEPSAAQRAHLLVRTLSKVENRITQRINTSLQVSLTLHLTPYILSIYTAPTL